MTTRPLPPDMPRLRPGRPLNLIQEQRIRLNVRRVAADELARLIGCSSSTIRHWAKAHGIQPAKSESHNYPAKRKPPQNVAVDRMMQLAEKIHAVDAAERRIA